MLTFAVTFVRHGETQYNKDKLLQGQGIDTPLSEVGLQQAEEAGQYLRELHFTKAFSSNLQRAQQTAEIILRNNIHSPGIGLISDALLRERGFGIAEGQPKDALKNMANAAGQSCRDFTPPGGETLDQCVYNSTQVRTRFRKFLAGLFQSMMSDHGYPDQSTLADKPDTGESSAAVGRDGPFISLPDDGLAGVPLHVLVVSHGAYIRVAVRHLVEELESALPSGLKASQVFSACPNTGMCRFVVTLRSGETGPALSVLRCIFINRKDHLSASKETGE
ncbi:fructose-2,6-bisphosphatase TIGAR B isoform X1 [Alosa sapidissima]|uniref:fructose-2,6-bisphosphatase TIGAR B isoform X1 n=1 Tax=Alosa sapidissima TaxID=34773 RepID=UPI001C08888C|nr:fructose-2,6-bisphosphatase TIGAR B isoform X1 [Alosa sapidissima]